MLGAKEARQNPNIVTGTFTLNNHFATTLFDSGADYSFVSTTFIALLGLEPNDLGFRYEIKIASGQLVEIDKVIKGCKLEIEGHVFDINLIPFGHGSFDVIIADGYAYPYLDVMDLGNSFKPAAQTTTNADGTSTTLIPSLIFEQEVKRTKSSNTSSNSQNMAFVSSPSSTNEVNTAYGVSTANTQVSPASTQRLRRDGFKVAVSIVEHEDKKSVSTATRWDTLQGNAEDLGTKIAGTKIKTALEGLEMWNKLLPKPGSQITNKSRKGVGFASYNVVPPPYTRLFSPPKLDLSNSCLEEFQQHEFEGYGPKTSKSVSEDISNERLRGITLMPMLRELVLDDKLKKKTVFPTVVKIEFVRPKQQEKPVRKLVKYAKMYRSQGPKGNQRKLE
ncbi:ribonuclease H-like domain-containing protein [Tanacetum coccineum]